MIGFRRRARGLSSLGSFGFIVSLIEIPSFAQGSVAMLGDWVRFLFTYR